MIYRKVLLLITLLLPAYYGLAQQKQQDSIHKLSIKQSIDYALSHQVNVVNAQYEVEKAGDKVKEIVGIGLPQINGAGTIEDFVNIPTTLIPAQFFGGPAGTFAPVKFGTQYNTSGELDASQLLFDGTYIVGLEASRTYRELSQKSLTQTKIQTVSAVTKAYYTVLVNYWKLQMVHADVNRLKELMDQTEAMYKTGFTEKRDWERIKVSYNNLKTQETNITKLVGLSYQLLKFQMGMPQHDSLSLTDSLKTISMNPAVEKDSGFRPENRIEYSLAQVNMQANELQLKKDKFSYLPNLVLFGTLSYAAYGNDFTILDRNQNWYPTSIVGLKMNLPIFSGFQRMYRVKQDRIGVLESIATLSNVKEGIYLQVSNSLTSLENALADLKNQQENMDLAQSVEHDSKIKYQAGTGSNLEVVDAETSLTEAETNFYNALFNALVAKVDYEQATGTLYNK